MADLKQKKAQRKADDEREFQAMEDEVPMAVKVWLQQVEKALMEVPHEALAVMWTLAATSEGREALVGLSAHRFVLHVMALVMVRNVTRMFPERCLNVP